MLNSPVKRFILPFQSQKNRELNSEVESAAIYAVSEFGKAKGGGLIMKQPLEKIHFISKMGYPIWLFPKNEYIYIFDGLNDHNFGLSYIKIPEAKSFIESIVKNSNTKEEYSTFLSTNSNYFQKVEKEKRILIKGLIVDEDFKKEFGIYRKEAVEIADTPKDLALLSPLLEAITLTSSLAEMDNLRSSLRENAERLPECLKQLNKTTSQYVIDLDYAAQAIKDEANAKIKALEEIVTPKIAKLNSTYKQQIANVSKGFNEEIERLEKNKSKTLKSIESNEEKIKLYQHEAKEQAEQNHLIYEKKWKEKKNQTKKETDSLKKELKRLENALKNLNKQQTEKTWNLQKELEAEIKLARQPLLDLEATRDAKTLAFKLEAEKLYKLQKPIIEGLDNAIKLAEEVKTRFNSLGIIESQVKVPTLFYVPFYVTCYRSGSNRRYIFLAPSVTNTSSFTSKLKGAFGISDLKQRFIPRFQTIADLIEKIQVLTRKDSFLEQKITDLGERNNLLNADFANGTIRKGLITLRNEGWLSDKEYRAVNGSLIPV